MRVDIKSATTETLAHTCVPAFFLHGTNDETVEYRWGLANYNACSSTKKLLLVEGAPHTLSILKNPEKTEKELTDFINLYFK